MNNDKDAPRAADREFCVEGVQGCLSRVKRQAESMGRCSDWKTSRSQAGRIAGRWPLASCIKFP
jgi:hypothetical protein